MLKCFIALFLAAAANRQQVNKNSKTLLAHMSATRDLSHMSETCDLSQPLSFGVFKVLQGFFHSKATPI